MKAVPRDGLFLAYNCGKDWVQIPKMSLNLEVFKVYNNKNIKKLIPDKKDKDLTPDKKKVDSDILEPQKGTGKADEIDDSEASYSYW